MSKAEVWVVIAAYHVSKFVKTAALAAREYYGLAVALVKVWVKSRGGG